MCVADIKIEAKKCQQVYIWPCWVREWECNLWHILATPNYSRAAGLLQAYCTWRVGVWWRLWLEAKWDCLYGRRVYYFGCRGVITPIERGIFSALCSSDYNVRKKTCFETLKFFSFSLSSHHIFYIFIFTVIHKRFACQNNVWLLAEWHQSLVRVGWLGKLSLIMDRLLLI